MFGIGLALVCLGLSGIGGMTAYYFMDKGKSNNNNSIEVSQILSGIKNIVMEYELSNNKEVEEVTEEVQETAKVTNLYDVFNEYESEEE